MRMMIVSVTVCIQAAERAQEVLQHNREQAVLVDSVEVDSLSVSSFTVCVCVRVYRCVCI